MSLIVPGLQIPVLVAVQSPQTVITGNVTDTGPGNCDNGVHRVICAFQTIDSTHRTYTNLINSSNNYALGEIFDKTIDGKIEISDLPISNDSRVKSLVLFMTKVGNVDVYYEIPGILANGTTTFTVNIADADLGAVLSSNSGAPENSGYNTAARFMFLCYDEYGSIVAVNITGNNYFGSDTFNVLTNGGFTAITSLSTTGRNLQFPDREGVFTLGLNGITNSFGGGVLSASSVSGTATIVGAIVGQPVSFSRSDGTMLDPALFSVDASVTSTDTVTVTIFGTGTPAAVTYNVTVHQ